MQEAGRAGGRNFAPVFVEIDFFKGTQGVLHKKINISELSTDKTDQYELVGSNFSLYDDTYGRFPSINVSKI